MFRIDKTTICKNDIERLLLLPLMKNILIHEKLTSEEVFENLCSNSEEAGWDIHAILSETILHVENEFIRNYFRRFLISEMYDILMASYPRGGTKKYCIMYADDNCILVESPRIIRDNEIIRPTSTIVLSPEGKVMVQENTVYIYEKSITKHGFTASWNDLYGLYTLNGEMLLPCIFERIEHKDYENYLFLRYKGIYYWMQYWVNELLNSANYRYKDIVLSFEPLEYPMSFLSETKEYKKSSKKLSSIINENSKELYGILDTIFYRLTEEELGREIEKYDSKFREK